MQSSPQSAAPHETSGAQAAARPVAEAGGEEAAAEELTAENALVNARPSADEPRAGRPALPRSPPPELYVLQLIPSTLHW